ncbi:hypothetical protein BGX31_000225 [Mortierella sp. GBA43]|nr:hypothetical protein BGX31_000225 [Mortierella sp. GBA43]
MLSIPTVSARKGGFELQTTLVSCSTGVAPGDTTGSSAGNDDTKSSTAGVAVCDPPESKLFGNVKVLDGTPRPGSTGIRGRLYDVGELCDKKITDKVDRAWIAFLDCAGCTLAVKLGNLLSSNPQAILIYNQTLCAFPAPSEHVSSSSSSGPISTSALSVTTTATGHDPAVSPSTTTTTAATLTAAPTPLPDQDSGDKGQDHDDNGDSKNGNGDQDNNGSSGQDDGGSEDIDSNGSHRKGSNDFGPNPRPLPHLTSSTNSRMNRRDSRITLDSATRRMAKEMDPAQSLVNSETTIAMAEQGTVDYLFQILLGPASISPTPGFLSELKTIHNYQVSAVGQEKDRSGDGTVITDLMVSISPAHDDASPSDSKFLSMSKPVFGIVIGILCAVVCGMVLMFIVRPLVLRRRRRSRRDPTDEKGDPGTQPDSDFSENGDTWRGKGDSRDDNSSAYLCSSVSSSGSTRRYSNQSTTNTRGDHMPNTKVEELKSFNATNDAGFQGYTLQRGRTTGTEDSVTLQQQYLKRLLESETPGEHQFENPTLSPSTSNDTRAPMSRSAVTSWIPPVNEPDPATSNSDSSIQAESDNEVLGTGYRNGSDLFHANNKKPPRLPMIDTKVSLDQRDFATTLSRKGLRMEPSSLGSFSAHIVDATGTSHTAGTSQTEPLHRFSFEHDPRKSMDSFRRSLELRSSRASPHSPNRQQAASSRTTTPRASFSEDFGVRACTRLSQDTPRSRTAQLANPSESVEYNDPISGSDGDGDKQG